MKDAHSLVEKEKVVSILLDLVIVSSIMLLLIDYDAKMARTRMKFVVVNVVFSAINKKNNKQRA